MCFSRLVCTISFAYLLNRFTFCCCARSSSFAVCARCAQFFFHSYTVPYTFYLTLHCIVLHCGNQFFCFVPTLSLTLSPMSAFFCAAYMFYMCGLIFFFDLPRGKTSLFVTNYLHVQFTCNFHIIFEFHWCSPARINTHQFSNKNMYC